MRRRGSGLGIGGSVATACGYAFVACLTLTTVLPFLYMVSLSLMDEFEVLRYPPSLIPDRPRFGNYPAALTALPFARFFGNSAIVAAAVVTGQVLTSAAAGYAFARLRFPGRDRIFVASLSVLMLPAIVLLIPRFLVIHALDWVDTYAGLIGTELVTVWGIFFLRQFFLTLPRDLEDAARLDGAGEWTIFWRVVLPLSKPALATLGVLALVEQWRSFLWPLIATRSLEMQVVEVGLASLQGVHDAPAPYQMAAAVTATVPVLIVLFVAQRYLIQGITTRRIGA